MEEEKLKFINNEILTLTILGGLGRGYPVYRTGIQENDKNDFKIFLREQLHEYGRKYGNNVSEKDHIENIKKITQDTTKKYSKILRDNKFRIGRTQKLLNLYLKYLWVLNKIPEPPHCPFDRKIIEELDLDVNWTKLDSIDDYKKMVEKARSIARDNNVSIAEWELKMWSRK